MVLDKTRRNFQNILRSVISLQLGLIHTDHQGVFPENYKNLGLKKTGPLLSVFKIQKCNQKLFTKILGPSYTRNLILFLYFR